MRANMRANGMADLALDCVEGTNAPMVGLPSVPAKPQGLSFAGVGFLGSTKASAKGGRDAMTNSSPGHSLPRDQKVRR